MKRYSILPAIFIFAISFLYSCKNDNLRSDKNLECKTLKPSFTKEINIAGVPSFANFWSASERNGDGNSYTLGTCTNTEFNTERVRLIRENLHLINSSIQDDAVYIITLFTTVGEKGVDIDINNTIGATLFYIKNKKLIAQAFKKKDGELVEIPGLNGETKGITANLLYANSLIFNNTSYDITALMLSTNRFTQQEIDQYIKNSGDHFAHRIDNL